MLDHAADDSQIPERLSDRPPDHDPGGIEDVAEFVQEKDLGNIGAGIVANLHKKSFFSDKEDVIDKNKVQKGKEYPDMHQYDRIYGHSAADDVGSS